MVCKGICNQYKVKKPSFEGRYIAGQKRCTQCEIFLSFDGKLCPCCHGRLRSKPRALKYKQKMLKSSENNI